MRRTSPRQQRRPASLLRTLAGLILVLPVLFAGCEGEDCVNCVELPAPVVPTGVHSISGDNEVLVQWYDISYEPYDGQYNENVVAYWVYRRDFREGDEFDPDRSFEWLDEVTWSEAYDDATGLHRYTDRSVRNGLQYEYAVAAVNAAGVRSALSFEFVVDAPLPMSVVPLRIMDGNGVAPHASGFDFSRLEQGISDPFASGTTADVRVAFESGVPYLLAANPDVLLQDFGVFTDGAGGLVFEGVSWAPADGYSRTGKLEIIPGHIYVIEIYDAASRTLHYAKLGIVSLAADGVNVHWAYQLIDGLPELSAPRGNQSKELEPVTLSL